jgi:hypothetical protein
VVFSERDYTLNKTVFILIERGGVTEEDEMELSWMQRDWRRDSPALASGIE